MNKYIFLLILLFFLPQNTYANSNGFDYPVGKPDGLGYYDAQDFGEWNNIFNNYHLGEDWNAKCGGDCDLGDPIYFSSDGVVTDVKYGKGWGNVLMVLHNIGGVKIKTLYAHMSEVNVIVGQKVLKGDKLGTIGKGDRNKFAAHLHFELRDNVDLGIGNGYGLKNQSGYLNPSEFINSHRPIKGSEVSLESKNGSVNISWTKSEDTNFKKYVLERSIESGAGFKSIFETEDINKLSFNDKDLQRGINYYYRVITYLSNGLTAESEEKSIELKREVINITNDPESQRYPTTNGKIVVWQDWKKDENGNNPRKLFYYDISDGEIKSANIAIEGVIVAQEPQIGGDYACYTAQDSRFSSTATNIYCYSFISNSPFLVTNAPKDQLNPVLNENGIVVWSDMRNGKDSDIYYLDLNNSNGEIPFITGGGNQYQPKISGNKVIWKDTRVGNRTDLYLKEIGGTEELIKTNIGSTGTIDISGDYIIWEKDKKLYSLNTKTKEEKLVSSGGVSGVVRVDSGRIAYSKFENGYYHIHVYDIATSTEIIIDFPIYYLPRIDISGNILVFDSGEKTTVPKLDIYLVYL